MAERNKHNIQIGVFPAIGYTLQTGFAVVVSTNAVIYKNTDGQRLHQFTFHNLHQYFLFSKESGDSAVSGNIVFQQ
ncbi:MAG: hypothetical protein WDM78_16365 [Puia sp.]